MKKRLFISSILMTLVLLVAITTATFAWYKAADAGLNVGTRTNNVGTITSGTQVSLGAQTVNFTAAADDTSDLALTYWDGSAMKSVGLINGSEKTETRTKKYGSISLSAAFVNWNSLDAQEKAAMTGQTTTVTIKPQGNLQLLSSAARTYGGSHANSNEVAQIVVTLTVQSDGSVTTTGDGVVSNKIYFAILPNNLSGAEYVVSGTDGLVPDAWSATHDALSSGVFKDAADGFIWKVTAEIAANGALVKSGDDVNCVRIDHGFDGITIE